MQRTKVLVILIVALIISIAAALSGCASPTASPTPTAAPSGTPSGGDLKAGLPATLDFSIQVFGGPTPVTLTYADLKGMEFTEFKGISTENSVGTVTAGDFVGVPLMDIVNRTGVPPEDFSVTAKASDGYNITYTKAQLERGMVAFKFNGTALNANINDDAGCIRIVVRDELKNMWLKMPTKMFVEQGAVGPVLLYIGGNVTTKLTLRMDDLLKYPQKNVTTLGKDNETVNATGVSLLTLLDVAGPTGKVVRFIAGDNYNRTLSIADIYNSPEAIVAIGADGKLRDIVPGQPANTWVSNLTKIWIEA